jgi:sulfur-carrier protein
MPVKVRIPSPLRSYTNGADVVEASGGTVGEVLNALKDQASGIESRLFKTPGELNRFVNVYLNDEDIRFAQKLDTPVKEGDEISIVPAIAGGTVAVGKVSVRIGGPFRPFVDGADRLEADGATVGEVLAAVSRGTAMEARLFKGPNQLNRFVNVFLNDEDVRFAGGLDAPVKAGDEINIVPAVQGGSGK